jgi:hypothetical protein
LWVAVITWCVSRLVVHRVHTRTLQQSMWRFHCVVWVRLFRIMHWFGAQCLHQGISFILYVLPWTTRSYGDAGGWWVV